MAQVSDLQASLDAIKTGVAAQATKIADLEAKLAVPPAPPLVTQEQLDALAVEAKDIAASLPPATP